MPILKDLYIERVSDKAIFKIQIARVFFIIFIYF